MTKTAALALVALTLSSCAGLEEALNEAFPTYIAGEIVSVTLYGVPQTKPDGSGWDIRGPADPFVAVHDESGRALFATDAVRDPVPSQYPMRWAVPLLRLPVDQTVWIGVYDDDVAEDDAVAHYRVRLSDVGGLAKPTTFPLLGPDGRAMAEVEVRWIEASP